MSLQEEIQKGEQFFSKLESLAGPIEEIVGVAGFFLPPSAAAVLDEVLTVIKFVQHNAGALETDIAKLAQDGESFYNEFKNSTKK